MAPEVVFEHNYDFPAEMWALGVVIYELATLSMPVWLFYFRFFLTFRLFPVSSCKSKMGGSFCF